VKRSPKLRARDKADALFSLIIRAEGQCRACGYRCPCLDAPVRHSADCRLQCAHIVSRRYAATRCDVTNAIPLCSADHHRFTLNPDAWRAWVDEHVGADRWHLLYERANTTTKTDWPAVLAELTVIATDRGITERGAA
jgi:hypothetical protein